MTTWTADAAPDDVPLRESDFRRIREMLHAQAGIDLGPEKHALVLSRLQKRVRLLGLPSFASYADLLLSPGHTDERQTAIDLLTTNETYFFREPAHFQFLKDWVTAADRPHRVWRVWSAASSSGEEAYSIAMTLADVLGHDRWEVLGSDISRRVLERARRAHYPIARMESFPIDYLRRFCLKGHGPQAGTLLIDRPVRSRVTFQALNFMEALPQIGTFDAVFLRNALIYFRQNDKVAILKRIEQVVRPGGHLFISHAESLFGLTTGVELVKPSVYRRPA